MLAKMIVTKQEAIDKKKPVYLDARYEFVLFGACAISLGCTLPASFKDQLKKMYKSVGLMRDAQKQMDKALNGLDGFKDGEPFEFDSPGLMETMMSGGPSEDDRMYPESMLMNVQSPFGLPPLSEESLQNIRNKIAEGKHGEKVCGGCGAKDGVNGTILQSCAKCKKRKYCSKECQKGHWTLHKKVCEAPEVGKENVKA